MGGQSVKPESEDRLIFLREFRRTEECIVNYLADNKIFPGKIQINNWLFILHKTREELINFIRSSEISDIIFSIGENEKKNIRIKKGELGDWNYLVNEKIEELQRLDGFYTLVEDVISEKIELELWKAQKLGEISFYCNFAEIFLPKLNENKLNKMYVGRSENVKKIKSVDIKIVYAIDESEDKKYDEINDKKGHNRAVYFENKEYSMKEAVKDADSFTGDVFFAKNSENYPLLETVIPIIGKKYIKMVDQQKKNFEMRQRN